MLPVTKIQHFCTKDGPGIRTTVFLKGCPLRCAWCHNPETQSAAAQFFYSAHLCSHCGTCAQVCPSGAHRVTEAGHLLDRAACAGCMRCAESCPSGALEACSIRLPADAIFDQVMKDAAFYGTVGGVTFSGGEPTVHAGELIPLLLRFRRSHIHTALETCGYFAPAILPELVDATDLFLWDIKDTDDKRHLANTGVSNEQIIRNLQTADALGAKTVLRCILLKTVNLVPEHLQEVAAIYRSLRHCKGVELIPYHTLGASKNVQLGRSGNARPDWIPSAQEISEANELLLQCDVPVIHN